MIDNEHQKWSHAVGGRRDPAVPVAALVTAFISGCGWSTHHDQCGVTPTDEYDSVENAPLFQSACSSVLKRLPGDLAAWRRTRVGDNSGLHPYPSLISQHWSFDNSLDRGVSRAYAAVNGKNFVMALTGVRQQVTLHETYKIEVVSLRNGSTVYAGCGPVTLYEDLSSAYLVSGAT
jgi:hypothetical protein